MMLALLCGFTQEESQGSQEKCKAEVGSHCLPVFSPIRTLGPAVLVPPCGVCMHRPSSPLYLDLSCTFPEIVGMVPVSA